MDPNRKQGLLDNLLAPLGQQIVNPDNQVTDMLDPVKAAERKRREEEERKRMEAAAIEAKYLSGMEAAAAQPAQKKSNWNPFVWMFGQPDGSTKGVLSE